MKDFRGDATNSRREQREAQPNGREHAGARSPLGNMDNDGAKVEAAHDGGGLPLCGHSRVFHGFYSADSHKFRKNAA